MNAFYKNSFKMAWEFQGNHRAPVLGLHCSGATGLQWARLRTKLDPKVQCSAPDLIGTPSRGPWTSEAAFSLADEAVHVISEMEKLKSPMHIVGHSYGGALALHIARNRPDIVCSVCVYEPALFSILAIGTPQDRALKAEIDTLSQAIQTGIEDDCAQFSAQVFTDFWGGMGAWLALSRERRNKLTDWIVKAPHDYAALLNEPEPEQIIVPGMPVTLIVGSHTHPHTARIVELLAGQSETAVKSDFQGAGHLGPFTFKDAFENVVLKHLEAVGRS